MTTPAATKPRRLTDKQERFIIEYAKTAPNFNATEAARQAGYGGKHLNRTAHWLLDITRQVMEERKLLRRQGTGIASLEQTLRLATAMAFHDPRKLFNEFGQCREVPELSRRQALMVAGFEFDDLFEPRADGKGVEKVGITRKFKMADRGIYVNMLLKYHGAFPTKKTGPEEPNRGTLPLGNLSLADRLQLRDVIAKFIEQKSAEKTIDVVNGNGSNGSHGSNGHGSNGHGS
jgi:Terminase small subunit